MEQQQHVFLETRSVHQLARHGILRGIIIKLAAFFCSLSLNSNVLFLAAQSASHSDRIMGLREGNFRENLVSPFSWPECHTSKKKPVWPNIHHDKASPAGTFRVWGGREILQKELNPFARGVFLELVWWYPGKHNRRTTGQEACWSPVL